MSLTVKGGVCQLGKITCPKSPFYGQVDRICKHSPTSGYRTGLGGDVRLERGGFDIVLVAVFRCPESSDESHNVLLFDFGGRTARPRLRRLQAGVLASKS